MIHEPLLQSHCCLHNLVFCFLFPLPSISKLSILLHVRADPPQPFCKHTIEFVNLPNLLPIHMGIHINILLPNNCAEISPHHVLAFFWASQFCALQLQYGFTP